MTFETAEALFAVLPPCRQAAVIYVFAEIKSAFSDVREAFAQAVADECDAIETEMLLLDSERMVMQ